MKRSTYYKKNIRQILRSMYHEFFNGYVMISPLLESIMLLRVVNPLIDDTIQLIFKLMKNSK